MRKFLLLIFVSFIVLSCKKQVVEPIVVNNSLNRFPKKVVKQRNEYGVDKFTIYKFKYNSSNLVSEVIELDSLSQDSAKTQFVYDKGLLKTKTVYFKTESYTETYDYQDNKLILITRDGETPNASLKIIYENGSSDLKYIIDYEELTKNDSLVFMNIYAVNLQNTSNGIMPSPLNIGFSKVQIYDKNRVLRDSVIYNIESSKAKFDYWYNLNHNHSEEYTFSDKNINFQYELREYILPELKSSLAEKVILNRYLNNQYCIKSDFVGSLFYENSYTFDSYTRLVKIVEGTNTSLPVTTYIYY